MAASVERDLAAGVPVRVGDPAAIQDCGTPRWWNAAARWRESRGSTPRWRTMRWTCSIRARGRTARRHGRGGCRTGVARAVRPPRPVLPLPRPERGRDPPPGRAGRRWRSRPEEEHSCRAPAVPDTADRLSSAGARRDGDDVNEIIAMPIVSTETGRDHRGPRARLQAGVVCRRRPCRHPSGIWLGGRLH